jgi:hypothetical protein
MDAKTRGWIIVQMEDWTLGQTDEDLIEVAERIYNAGCIAQAKADREAVASLRNVPYMLTLTSVDAILAAAQIVKGE